MTSTFRFLNNAWVIVFLVFAHMAKAGETDIANVPLVTSSTDVVLPNLLFILDNSGSMDWDFMPDTVGSFSSKYGYASSQCNGVYYNPTINYKPPLKSDGTNYPDSNFTSAWVNGYDQSKGVINLSTNFGIGLYQTRTAANCTTCSYPAYFYQYTGTETTEDSRKYYDTSSTFYKECNSTAPNPPGPTGGSTPGSSVFTYVPVSSDTGPRDSKGNLIVDGFTNFANWFSYYRTRMNMMKTATGWAFKSVGDQYRVGFMSINNNTSNIVGCTTGIPAYSFLNTGKFSGTQRDTWYKYLYCSHPNGSTPLRQALSYAGMYFAGYRSLLSTKGITTAQDPMQYSCQSNFSILSTDGFWNNGDGLKLDNTIMDNQDSTEPRPYFDGQATTVYKTTQQYLQTQTQITATRTAVQSSSSVLQRSNSQLQTRTFASNRWGNWSNTTSCTWGPTRQCQYLAWTTPATVTSCIPLAQGTDTTNGATWTSGIRCQYGSWGAWTNVSTCTTRPQSTSGTYVGPAVQCRNVTISTDFVASCTAASPSSGNGFVRTACSTSTNTTPMDTTVCTASSASPSNNYVTTTCPTVTNGPTAVSVTNGPNGGGGCTDEAASSSNNWTRTSCSSTTAGGTANALSDVAIYYYNTDLRNGTTTGSCTGALGSGTDVCLNNAKSPDYQNMKTFTLGLGARGKMVFNPSYQSATTGDYYSVKMGLNANPPAVCSWQTSGSGACNWPTPVADTLTAIDDLWHAAVNGRGVYFSATDPQSLSTGLGGALSAVDATLGASAAATTSNPNITASDNYIFSTMYTSVHWTGDLIRQQINPSMGSVPVFSPEDRDPDTYDWSAQEQLDATDYADRHIYTYVDGAVKPFVWAQLGTAQAYFQTPHISTSPPYGFEGLSQFCPISGSGSACLSTVPPSSGGPDDQTAAAGENLVNFLRGSRFKEGSIPDPLTYYRQRTHVLGDMINSEAIYVRSSLFNYADAGYADFKTANNASRQPVVYAAANDGMLHAVNADKFENGGGTEKWAYIPSFVLPNIYTLADKAYSLQGKHRYFTDGTPVTADFCTVTPATSCTPSTWKTILVAGLNRGGRGYYALDVTTPGSTPTLLWEFTDANMGFTYGNPVVTKLKDGTWVVLVTSGYNNVPPYAPSGDGKGYLYVLNAATGALIRKISTGEGSTGTVPSVGCSTTPCPSGLGRLNAWVDNPMVDNTALRVYAGDMFGNIWRFDPNLNQGTGNPTRLAVLKDKLGVVQPVTAKPELGEANGTPMVYIGTGRYLGATDLTNTQLQTFYAIKDNLSNTGYSNTRSAGGFIEQTITSTTNCPAGVSADVCSLGDSVRTATNHNVNLSVDNGWYVDLPDSGERSNTDPSLALGTLVFTTNIPNASACNSGGYSYRYFLDYRTGAPLASAGTAGTAGAGNNGIVGQKIGNAMSTRAVVAQLSDNNTVIDFVRFSNGETRTYRRPPNSASGPARRVSWREINVDK